MPVQPDQKDIKPQHEEVKVLKDDRSTEPVTRAVLTGSEKPTLPDAGGAPSGTEVEIGPLDPDATKGKIPERTAPAPTTTSASVGAKVKNS